MEQNSQQNLNLKVPGYLLLSRRAADRSFERASSAEGVLMSPMWSVPLRSKSRLMIRGGEELIFARYDSVLDPVNDLEKEVVRASQEDKEKLTSSLEC